MSCVTDIFSKYAWFFLLKMKKVSQLLMLFKKKNMNEPNSQPNKIWVHKKSEFSNRSMKSWLQDNDIEMYSANNDEKSVVGEGFIRTWKNKTYKYMALISKNVYIDKLDNLIHGYNNIYQRKIKIKLLDVESNRYIDSGI